MQIVVVGGDADHVAGVGRELREHDAGWHLRHVASAADVPAADGAVAGQVRQRFPGEDGMDGFFYARIAKR